jgi:FkbM family methyltransferase
VVELSVRPASLSLEVVPRDEIGRFLYVYGVWDLLGTLLMRRVLQRGMTVLDIGANIGYYTVLAANDVGPEGLVHSFEPHSGIRERLTRNVARNGLTNVVVRPEAVTNVRGEVAFYASADPSNEGISSTIAGSAASGERREVRPRLVPALRLDDVADDLDRRVDLVKLDVEGAELEACEGGAKLLASAEAPLVVFEAYELRPTRELLEGYGFTVRRLANHWRHGLVLVPCETSTAGGEPNYVAYKERHTTALKGLV